MSPRDETARLRRLVYALLLTVVAGMAVGRILAVERVNEPSLHKADKSDPRPLSVWPKDLPPASPLFGSNDRSRWATIRALVDHGTYAIGERTYNPDGTYSDRAIWRTSGWDPDWDTVDKVLDPQTHKFYSSKPPLLATVLAGLYWLLQHITGWTLANNLWEVVRTMLVLVNVLPFLLYIVLLARLAERFARTDWARLYVVVASCFATLVTPFLVTLNNHTIGTYCTLYAMYAALVIWCGPRRSKPGPAADALLTEPEASARTAHEPEASATGSKPKASARKEKTVPLANTSGSVTGTTPRPAAPWYLFAVAGLLSAFAASSELPAAAFVAGLGLVLLLCAPRQTLLFFVPAVLLVVAGFFLTNWLAIDTWRPAYAEFGTIWYKYPGSHWEKAKRGIDFAANVETRGEYVFHVLIGHHGLFSLTPMWLLAFWGMFLGLRRPARATPTKAIDTAVIAAPLVSGDAPERLPWWFLPSALLLSLVVIGFYLFKTDNYGGWTSGLRWLMWLTPIWLLCLLPALDRLSSWRWGRGLGYMLLALSVLSASYPAWNPWRHPWIYRWMDANGWIPY
jgi:hypothetical protein